MYVNCKLVVTFIHAKYSYIQLDFDNLLFFLQYSVQYFSAENKACWRVIALYTIANM